MLDLFLKGGLLMWPILLCSIVALAIVIHKAIQFNSLIKTLTLVPDEMLKRKPAQLASFLDTLMKDVHEEQLSVAGTRQIRKLEKGVGVLALIAVIAPLLGLTGTVLGMIESFQVLAAYGNSARAELLAVGIWEALITTAAGLLVAIPVHVAYHYLEGRLDEIALSLKELATEFRLEKRRGY
jgi:biopolymer transport protein ExbB